MPFHIRVYAPASARQYANVVRGIVEREKPAHVTYDIKFDK